MVFDQIVHFKFRIFVMTIFYSTMKKLLLTLVFGLVSIFGYSDFLYHPLFGGWLGGLAPAGDQSGHVIQILSGSTTLSADLIADRLSLSGGTSLSLNSPMTMTLSGEVQLAGSSSLTINSGSTLSLGDDIENAGIITVALGGNLIQTGTSTNSGSGTYNIPTTGDGTTNNYNLWSSPITGANILSVFSSANHCDIYHFDASGQEWVRLSSSSACIPAAPATGSSVISKGEGILVAGGGSVTYSGSSINNNTITRSISNAAPSGTPSWSGSGWNLIGNPYPSTINATDFINGNADITGTLYFWDDDGSAGGGYNESVDFATRNLGGGTGSSGGGGSGAPSNYIAIGQGFFVQSTTGGSATFSNSMREAGTATFFKSEPEHIQRVWLNANNSGVGSSQILIAFTDNATDGVDWGYDSKKLVSNADFVFGSSIELENEPFVIQSLNKDVLETEKEISLTLFTKHSGVSYIELAETENFDSNVIVYLKDYATGKIQDLSTGPFSVYLNANENYDSRFALVFKNEAAGPNSVSDNIKSAYVSGYEYDGTLFIKSPKEGLKFIRIVNMNGSVIETISLNGGNNSEINVSHLSPGLYVAQVSTNSGSNKTVKFIIK